MNVIGISLLMRQLLDSKIFLEGKMPNGVMSAKMLLKPDQTIIKGIVTCHSGEEKVEKAYVAQIGMETPTTSLEVVFERAYPVLEMAEHDMEKILEHHKNDNEGIIPKELTYS